MLYVALLVQGEASLELEEDLALRGKAERTIDGGDEFMAIKVQHPSLDQKMGIIEQERRVWAVDTLSPHVQVMERASEMLDRRDR